jgi:hypothetical protein
VSWIFSSFPTGATAVALLLLRASAAVTLMFDSREGPIARTLLALALMLGLLTPVASTLCGALEGIRLMSGEQAMTPFAAVTILHAIALALLGPGAYSLDARLFGRRRIVFSPRERPHYR